MAAHKSLFHGCQLQVLALYGVLTRSGLISNATGERAFTWCYLAYKRWFEAKDIEALREFVLPGSTVIDAGANIGFFTTRFGEWVGDDGGHVLALEPEPKNIAILRRRIASVRGGGLIEIVEGAATDVSGPTFLAVNDVHPGDHKLSNSGLKIRGYRIDELVETKRFETVSLIKIDVQGAEFNVLKGAEAILKIAKPVLYIEIDDEALEKFGSSADSIWNFLAARGYEAFVLERTWIPIRSLTSDFPRRQKRGYADYLFRPRKEAPTN